MQQLMSVLKRSLYGLLMIMIVVGSGPLTALAEETCTPPPETQPGVHRPVGADASTFSYNCSTGLWESAHYTFNPATGQTTPKDPPVYTYNAATGKYDVTTWIYHAPSGSYMSVTESVSQPPAGATVVGAPPSTSISNTGTGSNNTINNNNGATNGSSINNTGTNSNNTIDGSVDNGGTVDNLTNATVNNQIDMLATTGNAMVIGNTHAGSATSGNAEDIANIVNLLQSSSNALNGDTVTFVANIDGDVNGDFLLDPSLLGAIQPANANGQLGNDLTLNNEVNASINNDIDLTAESGDATVAGNTTGGDATSGSAKTIANVVNLINSAVTSGNSFLGVININGNLNGDILLPPDFIDQLIAANVPTVTLTSSIDNTGTGSNNTINNTTENDSTITNTNDLGITNNVQASATSGEASVTRNTRAGDATSGQATTSITAFNLTGSQVIGGNALLVFVNVSGSWVGLIVNAPPGATAAGLGGGLTQNTIDTGNIDNDNDLSITNNITANARSGDASVDHNTTAGHARSGNAHAAVNLMNVENSSLSLSGWFGVLFINVFGSWNGSFGVNTAAGNPLSPLGGNPLFGSTTGDAGGAPAPSQLFGFVARGSNHNSGGNSASGSTDQSALPASTVLAAATSKADLPPNRAKETPVSETNLLLPGLIGTIIAYVLLERFSNRNKKTA